MTYPEIETIISSKYNRTKWNAQIAPLLNDLRDKDWYTPFSYLVRVCPTNSNIHEAISGYTRKIVYGGISNAGSTSGSNATAVLKAACDNGVYVVIVGDYPIASKLIITTPNLYLYQSYGTITATTTMTNMIQITDGINEVDGITLDHLHLDGASLVTEGAVNINGNNFIMKNSEIEHVTFNGAYTTPFNNTLSNLKFLNNYFHDIELAGGLYGCGIRLSRDNVVGNKGGSNILIEGNTFDTIAEHAVKAYALYTNVRTVNNSMKNCGYSGVYYDEASSGLIQGNNINTVDTDIAAANWYAIVITGADTIVSNNTINTAKRGLICQGSNCKITNNTFNTLTSNYGIYLNGASKCILRNNDLNAATTSANIYVDATSHTNLIDGNFLLNGAYSGISLLGDNNRIINNDIDTCVRGIIISSGGDNNRVEFNRFNNNTTYHFNDSSGTVILHNNTGFISENSGTSIIPNSATYVDVTHGLSFTPRIQDITITPSAKSSSDPTFYIWISNIGASTFRVNCASDPSTAGLPFGWAIRYV